MACKGSGVRVPSAPLSFPQVKGVLMVGVTPAHGPMSTVCQQTRGRRSQMALVVDPTRLLRRPSDLVELVEAVIAASPSDEGEWIEWKSQADLGTTAGLFTLARQILGF